MCWNYPLKSCGPGDVTAGSGKKYWFDLSGLGSHGTVQRSPSSFKHEKGEVRTRATSTTLAIAAPAVAAQWHPTKNGDVTPADVTYRTQKKYWWKCDAGQDHEWEARVSSRVGMNTGCPFCCGRKVSETNSLVKIAPAVAAQ
jgi:hypothetical protein